MKSFLMRLAYALLWLPVCLADVVYWVATGRSYVVLDRLDHKMREWR